MADSTHATTDHGLDPEAYDVGYKDGFADGIARARELLEQKDRAYKQKLEPTNGN